jgi:hypothetical protein
VLARYEQQLVELRDALSKGIRTGDSEAAEAIRELIETVAVFRDHSRLGGVTVEIAGRLNALLGEQAFPNRVRGVWGKMVAEEGFEPPTHRLRIGWPNDPGCSERESSISRASSVDPRVLNGRIGGRR